MLYRFHTFQDFYLVGNAALALQIDRRMPVNKAAIL